MAVPLERADDRLARPPTAGLPHGVKHGRWSVPLLVDGRRVALHGEIRRIDRPSLWPWLALGAPFVVLTALLLLAHQMPLLRGASVTLGVIAAAATIAGALGFALASTASGGRWVEGANEVAFALLGLAIVAFGSPDVRALAGGGLGLLGLSVGFSKLPVLLHGVVLSALPALGARLAVALAIWAGAAASVVAFVVFFDVLERQEEPDILGRDWG